MGQKVFFSLTRYIVQFNFSYGVLWDTTCNKFQSIKE